MILVIPKDKIFYLLSDPGKSKFFALFGYSKNNWETLNDDITQMANNNPVEFLTDGIHGKKYKIIGEINTPVGRKIKILSIWIVPSEDLSILRLVTAYPA